MHTAKGNLKKALSVFSEVRAGPTDNAILCYNIIWIVNGRSLYKTKLGGSTGLFINQGIKQSISMRTETTGLPDG